MMPESWYPFFEWCEGTLLGSAVRDSIYAFPLIEALHLVALCVMGGALIVVDLRLLGLGLKQQGIAQLAAQVRPWLVGGIVVMLGTGVLLFLSEAIKCFYNTAFWVKILTLPVALIFTFAVRERLLDGLDTGLSSRLLGATSLALWFVVAAAGRWIGFS
ncbi:MAG: hypothetical protein AMS19_03980 [Gemmatimonas sp. SG8_23]|nr:MAG: hypothetical protein AMS19_03980 [Gemmatimonas sp. SG8_23]